MSKSLFGYAGETNAQKGRPTIKRDKGGHEQWSDAILPADAAAGVLETPTNKRPLLIVAGLIILGAVALAMQLAHLQLMEGQRNLGLADGNRLREKVTRAPRGIIYDRNKVVLAENLASVDITVTPSLLPRNDAAFRSLLYGKVAGLLGIPPSEVAAKAEGECQAKEVAAGKKPAIALAACLRDSRARLIVSNVERDRWLAFDQESGTLPGFSLDTNPIRQYNDDTLSAILGYTGRVSQPDLDADPSYKSTDFIGKLGIEKQYETLLRGQNGIEQTEVDATGRPIKLLASRPAKAGSNLTLTIDLELQHKLTDAIKAQMQASGATQAAGIAINPKNGEVLAVVNLPGYDNNLFARGISQNEYQKLVKNGAQPLFNKAIAGAFPVGSIIKPLISSAALQERAITPSTTVTDTGSIVITNKYDPSIKYTYRSYDPGGHGSVNVAKAIAVSSDVFFYTIGGGHGAIAGLGVTKLANYYNKFGLGQMPAIDLPEKTAGRVPTPEWKQKFSGQPWTVGDTYNISIGQGDLLASPLQMAVAEAAVANGGKVIQPHFFKELAGNNGDVTRTAQVKIQTENFIDSAHLNLVKRAMRDVVRQSYGTACCRIEQSVPVAVAAKTGTAETDPNGKRKPHAWFTAFAPYEDPQIEIVVLVQNAGEGAQYAAPAVRETLEWCFTRPGGCIK
ncbi:MAG TPA: penicillin-binding protein 2 [Candidatus Saccharimonadia bacterium]